MRVKPQQLRDSASADAESGAATLLAMRAVRLPKIDGNEWVASMNEERLLQGLILGLMGV